MASFAPASVKDTTLWRHLRNAYSGRSDEDVAVSLASNLVPVCAEASNRMKALPSLHNQYTLHDEVHLLRVTELAARLIPNEVLRLLNPVEVALVILAAHFHDQGMIIDATDLVALRQAPDFSLFSDNWALEHPNLGRIRSQLQQSGWSSLERERLKQQERELQDALLTDYIRTQHGSRGQQYVMDRYGTDKRLEVHGVNIAGLAARLCLSHTEPITQLSTDCGCKWDELVGQYSVNMPFVGMILRLADVLDFDRERTPDSLYRTIHFSSHTSLIEWEKHRSVSGWEITPERIRFSVKCKSPEYERAVRQYIDWIDAELRGAHQLMQCWPSGLAKYTFKIPLLVDRADIGPEDEAYIYRDLEFSLSRDEIVKLLMTDALYGSPRLSVREMIQNSLDALRYRQAMFRCDSGVAWSEGKIEIEHGINVEGFEYVSCTDNGIGMDEPTISGYLTRVGRSYYRSPEFERERARLARADADFDPCSQFGIGFMSYFMIGDHIRIQTRRDYGHGHEIGRPLEVEINGLGGLLTIRPGKPDQPVGTTVTVVGQKNPRYASRLDDPIRLIDMVKGYALATEFPIEARCGIPGFETTHANPANVADIPTLVEMELPEESRTFRQELVDVHDELGGWVKESFLVSSDGKLVTANDAAEWRQQSNDRTQYDLALKDGRRWRGRWRYLGAVCVDGIYVAGKAGRDPYDDLELGWLHPGSVLSVSNTFLVDARGSMKPELSPARTPPHLHFRTRETRGPGWRRLDKMLQTGYGRLWAQVAALIGSDLDDETFWRLAMVYRAHLDWMPRGCIWGALSVPARSSDGVVKWTQVRSLGALTPDRETDKGLSLRRDDGSIITSYDALSRVVDSTDAHYRLTELVLCMATVHLGEDGLSLRIDAPTVAEEAACGCFVGLQHDWPEERVRLLPFSGELSDCLAICSPLAAANADHPFAKLARDADFLSSRSELQSFAIECVRFLTDPVGASAACNRGAHVVRWTKSIGTKALGIDWSAQESRLRPPYAVWTSDQGRVSVGLEDFRRWAESEAPR